MLAKTIDCHKQCKCSSMQSNKHEAICRGRDLHYIPLFPENIYNVRMIRTNLTIDKNGFDNLTYIILKKFELYDNLISYIHPNAFTNLTFLATLNISNENRLNVDVLKKLVFFPSKKLEHLIFEHSNWSYLPLDMFSKFSRNKVTNLRIMGNALSSIKCQTFSDLNSLFFLILSENFIQDIDMTGIPSTVIRLVLNDNMLSTIPNMCVNRHDGKGIKSLLRNLSVLDLNGNSISRIQEKSLSCLPKLKKLLINGNPISRIHSNIFMNNPMLCLVQLSKIGYSLKKIDDFAFNSSSLSSLMMQETNFHFDQGNYNPKTIFSLSQNLTSLYLDHSYLPRTEIKLQQMFLPLKKLKVLSLSSTSLTFLPKNIFPNFQSLEVLSLTANRFAGWNDGHSVFGNMTFLRKLYLSNNLIKIINATSFPLDVLNSLEELDLTVNPFACTCDQLWFTKWIKTKKVKLIRYPEYYRCRQPPELDNVELKKYAESEMQCPPWNPLYSMAIVLSCSGLSLVTFITIGLKCQTNIKNYIYLWRVKYNRKKGYFPLTNADDFEYHAFVVYCDADRNWVHRTFLPKIEQDEGIKLCIHHRDFEVGESITANINKYLEKSWKVVVILSNEFAKSEWCQWEVDVVQERRRRYGKDVFLLIMLKTIDSKHMTNQLRALLDSAPSLRYQSWVGEDLFWVAAIETLRKPLEQVTTALL
ncbi:toll-like receptor 13 [Mytilus galloprovincialis]|nr:toll-like receptor 13 [Mytilus galloprovincialis]